MNARQALARLTVFLGTLVLALFVTRLFLTPPRPAFAPVAPAPVNPDAPPLVSNRVQGVMLDRAHAQTFTQLTIERDPRAPAPERVWVWTYLFTPDEPRAHFLACDPIEVQRPFARGDSTPHIVIAPCGWCQRATAPRGNFYARVVVTTQPVTANHLLINQTDTDIRTATPVVVLHE